MMHIVIPQIPSHRLALSTHTSLGHALKFGPFWFGVTNSHWSCQRTKWTCYSWELGLFKKFKPKFHKMHTHSQINKYIYIHTVHSRESTWRNICHLWSMKVSKCLVVNICTYPTYPNPLAMDFNSSCFSSTLLLLGEKQSLSHPVCYR